VRGHVPSDLKERVGTFYMAGERTPGHMSQVDRPIDIDDGTMCLAASCPPGPKMSAPPPHSLRYLPQEEVSFELKDAPFMCVNTSLSVISLAEMRVLGWLRKHRAEIVAAEQRFRVDRRAIAGAIAWEALENVKSWSLRAVGAAKPHLWDFSLHPSNTLVRQVEDAGVLPKQSDAERRRLLQTPGGAITYIAGAMKAAVDMTEAAGLGSIRCRPEILTNFWQGSDLVKWRAHIAAKKPGEGFEPGNTMALWVASHLSYLEDAVGKPALAECSGSR